MHGIFIQIIHWKKKSITNITELGDWTELVFPIWYCFFSYHFDFVLFFS